MRIIILGSAAGGGFPQWNCNCGNCRRARAGDPSAKPRTQASVAVSANGQCWFVLNCSPDLRQQILATPALSPAESLRHSPIAGALLTGGEIDAVAGLLTLRERQPLTLYATQATLGRVAENRIFDALAPDCVERRAVPLGRSLPLAGPAGPSGIEIELFATPGKLPLYLEDRGAAPATDAETEDNVGVHVRCGGRSFFYVPGCARLTPALARRLEGADLLFFDGTLWRDDEMIRTGTGAKTGRRMGHMSMAGEGGSLDAFASLGIGRKVYIHINNTNPVLIDGSPERKAAEAAGWIVAEDGMEFVL